MGIRFTCPSGHKLHVKAFLAGKRGVCPHCGARFVIPAEQTTRDGRPHGSTEGGIPRASDTASASMIIAVADEPEPHAPSTTADLPPAPAPESTTSSVAPTSEPPILPPPPTISDAAGAPEARVARYVSRRARKRRKQVNMAVALLAAVILLALILIWVVQRSGESTSSGEARKFSQSPFTLQGLAL